METFLTLLVACIWLDRPPGGGGLDYFNISIFIDRKKRHLHDKRNE